MVSLIHSPETKLLSISPSDTEGGLLSNTDEGKADSSKSVMSSNVGHERVEGEEASKELSQGG